MIHNPVPIVTLRTKGDSSLSQTHAFRVDHEHPVTPGCFSHPTFHLTLTLPRPGLVAPRSRRTLLCGRNYAENCDTLSHCELGLARPGHFKLESDLLTYYFGAESGLGFTSVTPRDSRVTHAACVSWSTQKLVCG